jgi:uncharacterized protein
MATKSFEVAQALLDPNIFPDKPHKVELVQTQMSFVFLTQKYVYKLKKSINLGYLDYTSIEKRLFFCQQEIILNRRLCPGTYLEVVPITRSKTGISIGGNGRIIDYLVKMYRLPQDRILNFLLEHDQVSLEMIEKLARKLALFHAEANTNPTISSFGKLENILFNIEENFNQTKKYRDITITGQQFQRIKRFSQRILKKKAGIIAERVASNHIRDCHGDLHSAHICFLNGICIFDCIEFNDRFRFIDTIADIAFLAMDLDHYGRADLSRRFINTYIETSQDNQIPELLRFYKCYRAYVRGKVESFKIDDPYITPEEREQTNQTARNYFNLAESYSRPRPILLIMVGPTGSGKTTVAQVVAKRLGLTVISSDVVLKQLASVPLTEHRFEKTGTGIYSAEFSRRTYERLYSEAHKILSQGDSVVLDATFLNITGRRRAKELADETGAEFFALECRLDEANIRQRLEDRLKTRSVSDGRWEVYKAQKKHFRPITEVAPGHYYAIDTAKSLDEQITQIIINVEEISFKGALS